MAVSREQWWRIMYMESKVVCVWCVSLIFPTQDTVTMWSIFENIISNMYAGRFYVQRRSFMIEYSLWVDPVRTNKYRCTIFSEKIASSLANVLYKRLLLFVVLSVLSSTQHVCEWRRRHTSAIMELLKNSSKERTFKEERKTKRERKESMPS